MVASRTRRCRSRFLDARYDFRDRFGIGQRPLIASPSSFMSCFSCYPRIPGIGRADRQITTSVMPPRSLYARTLLNRPMTGDDRRPVVEKSSLHSARPQYVERTGWDARRWRDRPVRALSGGLTAMARSDRFSFWDGRVGAMAYRNMAGTVGHAGTGAVGAAICLRFRHMVRSSSFWRVNKRVSNSATELSSRGKIFSGPERPRTP